MEDKYFDRLAEIIFDEQKIVTFKWLSKDLRISVQLAKQLLLKFYKENKTKNSKLTAVYCVNGILQQKDNEIQKICIIPEEKLANLKKSMKILSFHVYSIQLCKLQDSSSLYITDLNVNSEPISSIKCENKTLRSETLEVSASQIQIEREVSIQASKTQNKADEKDENTVPKSLKNTIDSQKVQNNIKKNDIASLFQNKTSKQPLQKKNEAKPKLTDSAESKNNIPVIIEEAKVDIKKTKDNKISSTQKKKSNKGTEKKKSNKRKEHEDEISEKRHKRIKVLFDSSDSDEGNDESIDDYSFPPEEEEEDPVPPEVKKSISDDSREKESQPLNKGSILQQKLISKTYLDEEGYLVTEKVAEMVEEPESLPHETTNSEKTLKEKPVERTNKLSLAQKTKKSSAQQKQSTLTNYFKKS